MWKLLFTAVVLLSGLLLVTGDSPGQQKNQDKKKNKDKDAVTKEATTPQDYVYLGQLKDITGKVIDVNLKTGAMTFSVEWSRWEPDPNFNAAGKGKAAKGNQQAAQLQQQLMRDYYKIMQTSNPVHRQQALREYQRHLQQLQASKTNAGMNLQNMFKIVKSSKEFDLEVVEEVKVARVQILKKYDDEGEAIKYTAEDLKKLKSPDVPGGYTAKAEELMPGQTVQLFLGPPKQDGKTGGYSNTDKQSADAKDKLMPGAVQGTRPQVRMVLILEEAPPAPEPKELPKKKKK